MHSEPHREAAQRDAQKAAESATLGRSAVTRLVWIAEECETLSLLRAPLLAEIVARRHKVLAIAPDIDEAARLTLLACGIDCVAMPLPGPSLNPFSGIAARRRLAAALRDWRANAAVVEAGNAVEAVSRAAAQSGCPSLYPVVPVGAINARPLRLAGTSMFAATIEDARHLMQPRQALASAPFVLPVATFDLAALRPAPLPGLDGGIIAAAVAATAASAASAPFASAAQSLGNRARFRLCVDAADHRRTGDGQHLEIVPCGTAGPDCLVTLVRGAHIVVIDGHSPRHRLALATALALGRPVVAIDTPLHRDLVDAGSNGWLVPADADADALTVTLGGVLKRPDLLPALARAARHKAERHLDRGVAVAGLASALGLSDLRAAAA